MLENTQIENLAQIALEATQIAADYISSEATKKHSTRIKAGTENLATQVVTAIDLQSQRLILAHLSKTTKTHNLGLLTEELSDDGSRFSKDYFWCIDPLDGTLPFIEQQSGYAVSVALVSHKGEPVIGSIVDPYRAKSYLAIKGQGCWIDGKLFEFETGRKETWTCHFDRSFTEAPYYDRVVRELQNRKSKLGFRELQIDSGPGAVMNALGLLDSACGCYFKFPKTKPGGGCIWDYAATSLIFQELGLHVSDISGKPLSLNQVGSPYMNQSGIIYSTNQLLVIEIIEIYKKISSDGSD